MENLGELQNFLTQRNIFTTSWGKTGIKNIQNLALFQPKTKTKKISKPQIYYQKKQALESQINSHPQKENLNICYLCLVYFEKKDQIIKAHLTGKNHQKQQQAFQKKPS